MADGVKRGGSQILVLLSKLRVKAAVAELMKVWSPNSVDVKRRFYNKSL